MNERELLERLAVLVFENDFIQLDEGIKDLISRDLIISMKRNEIDFINGLEDVSHQWDVLTAELWHYLPAQPAPDAPIQLELGSDEP